MTATALSPSRFWRPCLRLSLDQIGSMPLSANLHQLILQEKADRVPSVDESGRNRMTKVLITGGGGMIGQKIARRLQRNGLNGEPVGEIILADIAFPEDGIRSVIELRGSLTDPGWPEKLAEAKPDVMIHLAAILSGQAEQEFDFGWQVNFDATRALLEALRAEHDKTGGTYTPRFVFASSVAAFGPPFPPTPIGDQFICEPRTSYGTQKAMCELMISDYSKKGYVDGISLRLPTITVRPGKPNAAASSCFSSIIREPLNGRKTELPLSTDVRHMHASPRSAAAFFTHASEIDTGRLDGRRTLTMPSLTCSIQEQLDALRDYAGNDAVKLVKHRPDPLVQSIVSTWASQFSAERARSLGFRTEETFKDILQIYVEDDLPAP